MIGSVGSVIFAAVVLLGVLALVVLAGRLVRLRGWTPQARPGRRLAVQESVALDHRRRLHLVQCGPRYVVQLTGGSQDMVVGWIRDP